MAKSIVIAERDNIAAVFEDNKVSEFFIHRGEILLGDVYLSKVENILPSIEAAFVNVGSDKMGFLHAADVIGKGGLQDKLTPKQKLVVQVVKEPTGHKGPRVTTSISLPGRFCVLMPYESGISVSKKILSSKERARLKSIVSLTKPVGLGVIIRTEAEGQTDAEIQEDLEILLEKWNNIVTQAELVDAPNLLYRDQDLLYRVIREACTEDVKEIVVDTPYAMHRTQQLIQNWNLNKDIDISVYKGSEPLLVASGVKKEIEQALQIKVNLPSGGYLFIQTTEALTVIDVNSGKFISSATQDETILKTNKEAVVEIARQLKLRNIGGMIIIDFIDMLSRADKIAILEELELAVESDKAKPQVGQLSDLGLVEMTRHRQGQSLAEIFTKKCQHCNGTGQILDDFGFASSLAEGENRSKAAKLKLPMNSKNNKHNNNKVFNHQNTQNSHKNDYDRRNHKNEDIQDDILEITEKEQPKKDNKNKRFKNKRNNQNRREETQELIAQISEVLEQSATNEQQANSNSVENQSDVTTEQAEVNVTEIVEIAQNEAEKSTKTTKTAKKRAPRKTKKAANSEQTEIIEDNQAPESVENSIEPLEATKEEKPVKKTKTRKASRTRKKTVEAVKQE